MSSITVDKIGDNIQAHGAAINDAKYSPGGEWLATASDDATVVIWNMEVSVCVCMHLICV